MPVVKQDDSPSSSQASVMGWIHCGGLRCMVEQTHGVIAVEHHVDAGPQETRDQRDVVLGVHGRRAVMHQRVGFERDQGLDVVGGGDAHRLAQPADVADIAGRPCPGC